METFTRVLVVVTVVAGFAAFQVYEYFCVQRLKAETQALEAALAHVADDSLYLVIDRVHNRLEVRKGPDLMHEAVCATGSGEQLLTGRRSWFFRTPHGRFRVKSKVADPVWIKPDWAFVEEGEPTPPAFMDTARFDSTALGDYALQLGDGYLIHGTLFTNMLGYSVTHGCIRLDDGDLERVYKLAKLNTQVYIY